MAGIISALLAFPPEAGTKTSAKEYDTQIKSYVQDLNKVQPAVWTSPVEKRNILELLDPSIHSLPYLFALNQQIKSPSTGNGDTQDYLLEQIYKFLRSFDPIQVRYEGSQWHTLLDTLLRMYETSPVQDLTPVVSAMLRLDPTAGTFTQLHLRVLRLCLVKGVPSQVLPILDRDIYAFPQPAVRNVSDGLLNESTDFSNSFIKTASGFTPRISAEYVLEYYLLGGSLYLAMSRFARARLFFEYVMLTPSQQHAVSALQVEAYKRWILAGLLSDGRSFPLPKTLDQAALKTFQILGKAYEALADTFSKRDLKKYEAEINIGAETWNDDGNWRFVKDTAEALMRFRLLDLKQTYAALPVSRVARFLDMQVQDVLGLLANMQSLGLLQADVSDTGVDAILRFHLEDSRPPALSPADSLEAQTARLQELISHIRDASRRLQISKEYVDHQKREKRVAGADADLADVMDLTYDAHATGDDDDMDDEDIMR